MYSLGQKAAQTDDHLTKAGVSAQKAITVRLAKKEGVLVAGREQHSASSGSQPQSSFTFDGIYWIGSSH